VKKYVYSYIILALYVDDMLIVGANMMEIDRLKTQFSGNFEMNDFGSAKQILGLRISRDRSEDMSSSQIFICPKRVSKGLCWKI